MQRVDFSYKRTLMNSIRSKLNLTSVKTPQLLNPFEDRPDKEERLWRQLEFQQRSQFVPAGYGFRSGEPGNGQYDSVAILEVGVGTKKPMPIVLPETVWLPRTVLWVQALEIMTSLMMED